MYSLHKIIVSVLLVSLRLSVSGGDPYKIPPGADAAGMGSVCLTTRGFWSSFHNQAMLGENRSFSAAVNYENRFGISELCTRTAGLIIPAGTGSLGIIFSRFGYKYFRRDLGGIGCGLPLSENISAGVQIDCFTEKSSGEYDNRFIATFEAGMFVSAGDNISIGIQIFNPVPGSLRNNFLPTILSIGAGLDFNDALFAGAEAEMISGKNLLMKVGFEYHVFQKLHLRGGFCTENTSFSFGMGYLLKSLKLDLAFSTHEMLGITSSVSLAFMFNEKILN